MSREPEPLTVRGDITRWWWKKCHENTQHSPNPLDCIWYSGGVYIAGLFISSDAWFNTQINSKLK